MNLLVFSVFDSKAKVYAQPFTAVTLGVALRSFTRGVNDSQSQLYHSPEDFTLFQVGVFDDASGVLTPLAEHVNCGLASRYKEVGNAS